MLASAGFSQIALEPLFTTLRVSEAPGLPEAARAVASIGPVSRLLTDPSQDMLDRVFPAVEAALQPYFRPGALEMGAAVWLVTAVKP